MPGEQSLANGKAQPLLDAALEVVAARGLRGLTYRAVEAAADMPHGSVTYHFKSWDGLVRALLTHIARRSQASIAPMVPQLLMTLSDRSRPLDIAALAQQMVVAFDRERDVQLARYELQTGGARDPALGECVSELTSQFEAVAIPIVTVCGSTQPARDALLLVTAVDGWVFSRLTLGRPDQQTFADGVELLLRSFAGETRPLDTP